MNRSAILATALVLLPSARPAPAEDKILRVGSSFVEPATDPSSKDAWYHTVERTDDGVDGAAGFGLGFEVRANDRIGIDTRLATSRHNFHLDVSGQIGWTPWYEEHDAARSDTAPLLGEGAGHVDLALLTVGVNFHLPRRGRVDLYAGPLAGVSYREVKFDTSRFTAALSTPFERREAKQQAELVVGAVAGADVPFGDRGWTISTAARYLETEMEIDSWTVEVGMGYSF